MPVQLTCQRCYGTFYVKPYIAPTRKFCTQKCAAEQRREDEVRKYVTVTCGNPTCQIKIDLRRCRVGTKQNFCTWACFQASQPAKITLTCQNTACAKQFMVNVSAAYYMYCSKLCRNTCSPSGNVTWYTYADKRGNLHRVQGGWELAYITYLDDNDISFETHPCMFHYFDEGKKRSYFPDFRVRDGTGERYVDVKNDWLLASPVTQHKLACVRVQNPTITLVTLDRHQLATLGIVLPVNEEQRLRLCNKNLTRTT